MAPVTESGLEGKDNMAGRPFQPVFLGHCVGTFVRVVLGK
jgi:hypothetical protein